MRKSRLIWWTMLGLNVALVAPLRAQRGDRKGHVMNPPPTRWHIPRAPVVSPRDAPGGFSLEEGFRVELVASDPMIHDPVALAFDGNGRIWLAEMRGYMPDIDGKKEGETFGRISVLEDSDNDGAVDKRTVFIEKVNLPRAVSLTDHDHKLLFADNKSLYEVEIIIGGDGQITAGKPEIVAEDYASGGNPEHKSNGLLHGLDNWIYSAASDLRFRKIQGKWISKKTERRGQWGIDQDDYGRIVTNTNSNFVTVEELPPNITVRNPDYIFHQSVTSRMKDQKVWPSRINPGVNRGYMKGTLDENGYLLVPTAASGLAVYRGDQFPHQYYGNLFLNEPAGNLVKRAVMTGQANGFREVKSATKGKEFFTSTDERCRIVNCYTAPDGTLYLVDFYRGILQHAAYMTSFLRAQVEERKLQIPVGLGRIWRVVYQGDKKPGPTPRMEDESTVALVAHLTHPNGWWRNTAQRLIVERGADAAAIGALNKLAVSSENPLGRIHAIWTLEGLNALQPATIEACLKSDQPHVTAETIRASEYLAETSENDAVLKLIASRIQDKNLFVRRQLASSLGLFGEKALDVLVDLMHQDPDDPLLPDLVMSGISGEEMSLFQRLPDENPLRSLLVETVVRRGQSPEISTLMGLVKTPADFRALGKALAASRRTNDVLALLTKIGGDRVPHNIFQAAVAGMMGARKDKKFKPMPIKEQHPLLANPEAKKLTALFTVGTGRELVYLKSDADKRQFQFGELHYQRICLPCHQIHGKGQQFLAPPIVASEWVMGPRKRLIALAMDGAQGPIQVLGRTYKAPDIQPVMPGLRSNPELNDEQLAAILTYVRNAWGNGATPVSVEEVERYRSTTKLRAPYSPEELLKIK